VSGKPLPPEVWEVVAASLILAWRAWCYPLSGLWRDWVFIFAAFWIVTALAGRTRAWPVLFGLLMTALFVLYSVGQVPLSMAALGNLR